MDIMDRLKGPRRNLPIGIQSFERLRRDGYLYVDKTAFVYELASTGNPYFLSRPRRFGKTVAADMIASFFGKGIDSRSIFEKLSIRKNSRFEKHLNKHNVIHISFNEVPKNCKTYEHYIGRIEQRLPKTVQKPYHSGIFQTVGQNDEGEAENQKGRGSWQHGGKRKIVERIKETPFPAFENPL